MPEAPYKIRDRRGTSQGWGRSDLFDAAAPRNDERTARVPQSLDRDGSALMGQQSRVALMRIARYLCANFPQVRNAVAEMATYTTASFIPQFGARTKRGASRPRLCCASTTASLISAARNGIGTTGCAAW
jgi:hypothetical protein